MGSVSPTRFHVKQIAIIGAGPSGLATAKYLIAQHAFTLIVIFEQQHEIGGIWVPPPTGVNPPPSRCSVPQTNPFLPPEPPVSVAEDRPRCRKVTYHYPSAVYDNLSANTVGSLMQFSDEPFPSSCLLFPSCDDMRDCILRYGHDVRHLIRFRQQVTSLELLQNHGHDQWRLRTRDVVSDEAADHLFDAVVVASGHYSVPFIPDLNNSATFHDAHPSVIIHSREYRSPESYRDKRVIVVGNGPSGVDIAGQINAVSKGKTLLSVKKATAPETLAFTGCDEASELVEFLVDERGVRFKDGRVETDVDAVIFCTGFLYSFPFLKDLHPKLIASGHGVHGLYKHMFYAQHPTLVFSALPSRSVPWPLSECQAAVVAAVWSNQLELPPIEVMQGWSKDLHERVGEALQHLPPGGNHHYINELHDWAIKASYLGKQPPRWSESDGWQHLHMSEIRRRFHKQGARAKTWADLGIEPGPS
ncbi:thiol-specific monooxygenase [Ophiocordyceps camponoti-floridani]|uniref:Thiol-specific monooxygenase n=1 Tax=Ophiocordyceps camponoti-floridani TaxID=2030778 RepID=A0A8H4Q4Z8_9HYPO|nr:thiol-specific monooxygenase [Ophiocordyceps camponoti-floridani]